MTRQALYNKILSYTKQNQTSLTTAQILPSVNDAKNELMNLLAGRDIKGNYFILPSIANLIAGQREYALPPDVLNHIYTVEVAFSSTTDAYGGLPYVQAFPDDFRRLGLSRTEPNITANYTNGGGSIILDSFGPSIGRVVGPRYEIQRRSIYILSGDISSSTLGASSITGGLRIRYRQLPLDLPDLTDSTNDMSIDPTNTSFGIPLPFHELLARRVSLEWKGSHPGAVPLSPLEENYANDLEAMLSGIEMNDMSDEILGKIPYQTGWDI